MKTDRLELLSILKLCEPGLAPKPLIEELVHVWYTGEKVFTFNDTIGIVAPLKTEFKGSMKGSLILGLLEKSRARDIEILPSENENEVLVKAANARLNLAYFPIDQSIWQPPKFPEKDYVTITKELLKAIDDVLISIGQDTSIPDQLGVTLQPVDGHLRIYTTDSKTISRAVIPFKQFSFSQRIILPAVFCEQLLKICKQGGKLAISNDSVMAESINGVQLFSRLIESVRPLEFDSTIEAALAQVKEADFISVPNRFKLAIERVSIVLESHIGEPAQFTIQDGTLRLFAQTNLGQIKDSMRLEGEHESIDLHVDPTLVKRALAGRSHFYLLPSCIVLSSDNFIHLISTAQR